MATKKVTSKREINNVLDNLVEVERSASYADCAKEYTYTSGTFRCTIDTYGTTLEEQKELLRRRALRIDNRRDINTQKLDLRSNRLQRAMAFIGEHREMIPFLTHVSDSIRQGVSMDDAVADYCNKHGRPTFVHRDYNHRTRDYFYNFAPRGYYESELVAQVPYLPKAWRCA